MVSVFKPRKTSNRRTPDPQQQLTSAKPQLVDLVPDKLDIYGKGVCSSHAPVVFVEGGLPGENCQVSISQHKKQVWLGRATRIENPHKSRVRTFCQHYKQCGGCQLQHIEPSNALAMRQAAFDEQWKRLFRLENIPWASPVTGQRPAYRRKARLAIDARNANQVKMGYREVKGKSVVSIDECPILVSELQALIQPLSALLSQTQLAKCLGHISLLAGDNVAQVTFKAVKQLHATSIESLNQFGEQHSVNIVVEDMTGEMTTLVKHETLVCETVPGLVLKPQPNHFVQVNRAVNSKMIAQALEWLSPNEKDRIADLYCGLGNFSLALAHQGAHVRAVEGVASMVQQAKESALSQGIEGIEWLHLDLNDCEAVAKSVSGDINKVLLDPSREGARKVCETLSTSFTGEVLYVSCNPTTFARDAQQLLEAGFKLKRIGLIEMFPYTSHLEVMALFEKPLRSQK